MNGYSSDEQDDVSSENFLNERIDTGHHFITEKEFTSLEEMKKEVEKMGRENNIHIITYTFNAKRGLLIYACDKSGPYRPPKTKALTYSNKFTGTRKTNCPFRLKALRQETGTWKLFVRCGFHNHELDDNPFGHAKVGKVDQATKEKILNLSKSHVSVGDILTNVGDDELTARQIYNIRQRQKAKSRENRTASEQLLKLLIDNGYRHWYQTIPSKEPGASELTDIIFCPPGSLDMLRQYRYVLVVDSTYNTNMYKMPLLEVVGVTPTHRNFSIFFAFLQNEKDVSYEWALKCMREVFNPDEYPEVIISDRELALIKAIEEHFPTSKHLLCRRHIEKNVEAWVKGATGRGYMGEFAKRKWDTMVKSLTEEDFVNNEKAMYEAVSTVGGFENYCKKTWINLYKEKFVSAWTNKVLHLGNVTTNRVEGAHAALKRYLRTSVGSFDTVWEKIHDMVKIQRHEIERELGRYKTTALHVSLAMTVFRRLKYYVSHEAIKLLDNAFIEGQCNGCALRSTHGLPCSHEIANLINEGKYIELNSIHPFWRTLDFKKKHSLDDTLSQEQERFHRLSDELLKSAPEMIKKCCDAMEDIMHPSNIADPTVKKTRGRPKKNSTARDPSHWEYIEKQFPTTRQQRGRGRGRGRGSGREAPDQSTSETKGKYKRLRQEDSVSSPTVSIPTIEVPSKPPFPYPSAVLNVLDYITDWHDPGDDGNCGFRAIAHQLYADENEWVRVRRELLGELMKNSYIYANAFGSEQRVQEIAYFLSHYKGRAPVDKWMDSMDLGFVIATLYNVVFTNLSLSSPVTYLPLIGTNQYSSNWSTNPSKFITLVLVAKHFYWARLACNSPLPRLHPSWEKYRDEACEYWREGVNQRLLGWKYDPKPATDHIFFDE